jgi:hypothetical protein
VLRWLGEMCKSSRRAVSLASRLRKRSSSRNALPISLARYRPSSDVTPRARLRITGDLNPAATKSEALSSVRYAVLKAASGGRGGHTFQGFAACSAIARSTAAHPVSLATASSTGRPPRVSWRALRKAIAPSRPPNETKANRTTRPCRSAASAVSRGPDCRGRKRWVLGPSCSEPAWSGLFFWISVKSFSPTAVGSVGSGGQNRSAFRADQLL